MGGKQIRSGLPERSCFPPPWQEADSALHLPNIRAANVASPVSTGALADQPGITR